MELSNCVSIAVLPTRSNLTSSSMILRKAGAAFAAGCCMVVKPSPETPLSVLALAHLAEQAGFPRGVFSVLTTSLENTPELSEALCRHPLVKKVTFTGSVFIFLSSVPKSIKTKNLTDKSGQIGCETMCRWSEKGNSRAGRELPIPNLRRCEPPTSRRWYTFQSK